jgi:hypothetical protein
MRNRIPLRPQLAATAGKWVYLCCHCFVRVTAGIVSKLNEECAACGNTNLRFIHTLENIDDHRQVEVGIECARALIGPEDCEIPRLAENEVKRKERWRIHYRRPGRCVATINDLENRGGL